MHQFGQILHFLVLRQCYFQHTKIQSDKRFSKIYVFLVIFYWAKNKKELTDQSLPPDILTRFSISQFFVNVLSSIQKFSHISDEVKHGSFWSSLPGNKKTSLTRCYPWIFWLDFLFLGFLLMFFPTYKNSAIQAMR